MPSVRPSVCLFVCRPSACRPTCQAYLCVDSGVQYEDQVYLDSQAGTCRLDKFTHCLLVKCSLEVSLNHPLAHTLSHPLTHTLAHFCVVI